MLVNPSKPGPKPEGPTRDIRAPRAPSGVRTPPPPPTAASPLHRRYAAHARTPTPAQAMLHLLSSPLAYAAPEKANVMKYFFGSK